MEAGLVAQSVSLLGESKICDIRKAGVMDQLKAQVVFQDESGNVDQAPEVHGDLYSNPKYFCDTMEADVDEGRGREGDTYTSCCRGGERGLCGTCPEATAEVRGAGLVWMAI